MHAPKYLTTIVQWIVLLALTILLERYVSDQLAIAVIVVGGLLLLGTKPRIRELSAHYAVLSTVVVAMVCGGAGAIGWWRLVIRSDRANAQQGQSKSTNSASITEDTSSRATDKATAKVDTTPRTEVATPKVPLSPKVEIGLVLGADKGIGIDSIVDCNKPIYKCLSESELQNANLVLDVGDKGWGRLIFRFKNVGGEKVLNPVTHIESSEPISIENAAQPDPSRVPRNVLDIVGGHEIYPFSVAQSEVALPIDVTVPGGIGKFDLRLNIFGDNMKAHIASFHFDVKR